MEVFIIITIIVVLTIIVLSLIKIDKKEKPKTALDEIVRIKNELEKNEQYQILKMRHEFSKEMTKNGTEQDIIPEGYGKFGYTKTNPIPIKGISEISQYFKRLKTVAGDSIEYKRVSTTEAPNINDIIDVYEISVNGNVLTKLFISAYNKKSSEKSPQGFKLTSGN